MLGDTAVETDETVKVDLSAPSNGALSDAQGVVTITNDDSALPPVVPVLSVDDATANPEGNSGTTPVTFT